MQSQIRGAVFSKFSSVCAFAREMGWTRQKATRIVKGLQSPTADEIEEMTKLFEITDSKKFMETFFPNMSTM